MGAGNQGGGVEGLAVGARARLAIGRAHQGLASTHLV